MTALQSCSSPAAFHMRPESRIIGGIDASMMMSLGTCRFVIPRAESTIASAGPLSKALRTAASIGARSRSGRVAMRAITSPHPLFGSTPSASKAAPCAANTSAKNTFTAWPKMMGSETFIIVALRCSENSRLCALAPWTWSIRKSTSARRLMKVASSTSPSWSWSPSFSTLTRPSALTCSILAVVAAARVTERSFE